MSTKCNTSEPFDVAKCENVSGSIYLESDRIHIRRQDMRGYSVKTWN